MPNYTYPAAIALVVLALLFLWRGMSNVLISDLHKLRGRLQLLLCLILFIAAGILIAAKVSFAPYTPLPKGKPIAHMEFEIDDQQSFSHTVTVTAFGDLPRRYKMSGDQWHMQLRVIRWSDELMGYGFVPMFQITELASSYSIAKTASQAAPNSYNLTKNKWLNIEDVYQNNRDKLHFMQVRAVASDKVPFIETASYDLYLEADGSIRTDLVFK